MTRPTVRVTFSQVALSRQDLNREYKGVKLRLRDVNHATNATNVCALLLVPAGQCELTSHLPPCQVCAVEALGPTDEGLEPPGTMPLGVPRGNSSGQKTSPPVLLPRKQGPCKSMAPTQNSSREPDPEACPHPAGAGTSGCPPASNSSLQIPRTAPVLYMNPLEHPYEHLLPWKGAQTG